ncbi:replication factor C, subunit RFC1 [Ostreococcus tauri]|uniref:Replication factor C, subunit RFC1 n=1 Tax=Ostreococcus tauri TaxID=70448 RepID=A0A1Y5IGE2_OSTTA|nr:replication factor C, subunit RFC1 [Ostreococcus tauri]
MDRMTLGKRPGEGDRDVDATSTKRGKRDGVVVIALSDSDDDAAATAEVEATTDLAKDDDVVDGGGRRDDWGGGAKKVHAFFSEFAKRRDAAREARERGETNASETIAEFVQVKPAPIEEALGPIHVGYVEYVARDGSGASASTRVDAWASRALAPCATTHAVRLCVIDDDDRKELESARAAIAPRPRVETEEEEDAFLRAVAVAANRVDVELDGAPLASDDELVRAKGVFRNDLARLKFRAGAGDEAQWVDRYKPGETADAPTQQAVVAASLRSWLGAWKRRMDMQAAGKTPPSPTRPCLPRKVYTEDDDEYWESDDEDDGLGGGKSVANGILMTGPTGCGKTAMVYALANEFGFKVLEANALDKRSGQEILGKFMEATQSKRFNKKKTSEPARPPNTGLKAFFGGTSADANVVNEKPKEKTQEKQDTQSLILFEEVDIEIASERGFMAALSQIVESTKRPVILTSNTPVLHSLSMDLPLARVRLDPPTIRECAAYGALVSAAAGAPLRPSDTMSIAFACKGDLRRTVHNAQLASFGDGVVELDSIDFDRHSTALIAAARKAALDGSKRIGAMPLDAAKDVHTKLIESERKVHQSMVREVEAGLVRHQDRLARWEAIKEAKRVERVKAKAKLLGYEKPPLDLKDAEKSAKSNDEDGDGLKAKIAAAIAAFDLTEPENQPDWLTFDASPPEGGWNRACDELSALAALARTMSQVDVMRSTVRVGITGPCRVDAPWTKETVGDHEAIEDCAASEDFYLSNGPARQTLGGNDNVSFLASDFLTERCARQFHDARRVLGERYPESVPMSQPACAPSTPAKASKRARGSTRAPLADQRGSMHVTWRARALADCLGGRSVNSEATTDRLGYIARMVRIQNAPKALSSPSSRGRNTRKRHQHLILPREIRADLLDVSHFGGDAMI